MSRGTRPDEAPGHHLRHIDQVDLLARLQDGKFHRFESMFTPEEGKQGVLVTFLAVLELAKEQLLDIVQEAPLAAIYVKSLALNNTNEPLAFSSEFDDDDAANDG